MAEECREALERAGRSAPSWVKAAWAHVMGVYSPDVRWESNALRGFVSQLAEMLARLCSTVLHRGLLSQRVIAIRLSEWEGGVSGEHCGFHRRIELLLDTGLRIDIKVGVVVSLDGSLKAVHVSSDALRCEGERIVG